MTAAVPHVKPSARVSWATWAIAFCCDSYSELFQIVTPLWALHLGFSPFQIGVLVAARASLSLVLIIHGGALVDRFGTKRILVILAAISAFNPLLFPILPWFPALIVLQMAGGLAAPVRGVDGLRASVGVVTLADTIDEGVVAPQVRNSPSG